MTGKNKKTEIEKNKPKKISDFKLKTVKEFENLVKNKKTILVASIKNIPASQIQEISKKLRGKAIVKVPKKNLIFMGLDSSKDKEIEKLKTNITKDFAILFSDLDSFELAGELIKNQSPAKAKMGQIANEDLEIPEGPTELVPGPAVSELSALGIKIQIEKGKITIKEPKIIAKKGEKISRGAADLMNKLDIRPFKVGFIPLCSFETKEKIFYSEIKIDKEGTIEQLKIIYSKALPFAIEIGYSTNETIKFLIGKAGMHEKVLEKLASGNGNKTKNESNTPDENKSEGENK